MLAQKNDNSSNSNRILHELVSLCTTYKGQYEWLDSDIDELIQNANDLFSNFPSDGLLENMNVDYICNDHHDGYINEIYVSYPNEQYNGLCIRISVWGYDVIKNDAEEFGSWDIADRPIKDITRDIYRIFLRIHRK